MKRLFLMNCVMLGMTIFLVANIGFAQDVPKTGCPKQTCLDNMDADKNGQISESEFLEYRKKCFTTMDIDKTGSISKDEFKKCCMRAKSGSYMKGNPVKGKECPYMKNKTKQ